MENKIKRVLIYGEVTPAGVNPVYFELLAKAKSLFAESGAEFCGVAFGSDISAVADEMKMGGVSKVYILDDPRLAIYNPEYICDGLMKVVEDYDPDLVLVGATLFGEEIAPTLGGRLCTGVAAHAVDIVMKEGNPDPAFMIPAFGGKVIGEIFIPDNRPQIASIKPGMCSAESEEVRAAAAPGEIVAIDASVLDNASGKIKAISQEFNPPSRMPVDKAKVIVCGGFGIGSQEAMDNIVQLAEKLGGAAGCTRPVVDAGWVEDESGMLGTSGKTVKPKVYLGAGISGAAHHICGIKDSGVIININNDANAEIFAVSDYKVVADGAAVMAEILKQISE